MTFEVIVSEYWHSKLKICSLKYHISSLKKQFMPAVPMQMAGVKFFFCYFPESIFWI